MAVAEEASRLGREYYRERLLNVIQRFSYRVHPDPIRFTKYNKGDIVIIFNDDLNRRDVARYYSKWFIQEKSLFMVGDEVMREVVDFWGPSDVDNEADVPVLGPPKQVAQYMHVRKMPSIPFRIRERPRRVHIETLEKMFALSLEKERYDSSLEKGDRRGTC